MQIFIVEDHSATSTALKDYLEGLGHFVSETPKFAEASARLTQQLDDLLFINRSLFEDDGFKLLENHPQACAYAVVMTGDYLSAELLSMARTAGFHHYLQKPFGPQAVNDVLLSAREFLRGGDSSPPLI